MLISLIYGFDNEVITHRFDSVMTNGLKCDGKITYFKQCKAKRLDIGCKMRLS